MLQFTLSLALDILKLSNLSIEHRPNHLITLVDGSWNVLVRGLPTVQYLKLYKLSL